MKSAQINMKLTDFERKEIHGLLLMSEPGTFCDVNFKICESYSSFVQIIGQTSLNLSCFWRLLKEL